MLPFLSTCAGDGSVKMDGKGLWMEKGEVRDVA